MLGSLRRAEDLVQETLLRAWRRRASFEGRSRCDPGCTGSRRMSAWTRSSGRERRARPMDLDRTRARPRSDRGHPAGGDVDRADARRDHPLRRRLPGGRWRSHARRSAWPSSRRCSTCPPRQRAVLILLRGPALEGRRGGGLFETSVRAVNSALQRVRAALDAGRRGRRRRTPRLASRTVTCSRVTSRPSRPTTSTRSPR